MTINEFKKLSPESASLEGDELWNAMEDYMLKHGNDKISDILLNKPPPKQESYKFVKLDISKGFRIK